MTLIEEFHCKYCNKNRKLFTFFRYDTSI